MADNLTPEQRSRTMSRIRSRNTEPEMIIRRLLHACGLRFRIHVRSLAGCPDVVFTSAMVVVFVDGDFWHGWRFSRWSHKLAPYWKQKIERNRARDARHLRSLRRAGWTVLRIWEHQVERDAPVCVRRIVATVRQRLRMRSPACRDRRNDRGRANQAAPGREPERISLPLES